MIPTSNKVALLELTYSGKFETGSSGSPVFLEGSERFEMVALHRSGDLPVNATEASTEGRGILLSAILRHLLKLKTKHADPSLPSARTQQELRFVAA